MLPGLTLPGSLVPGDRNVTVAAIPSSDLAGLYIAQDDGFSRGRGCT